MSRSLAGDVRVIIARIRRSFAGLPGWVAGIVVGVQAAVLSALVVIAPAIAVIAATPSPGGTAAVDWSGATAVALKLWLLAHSVPIETDAATFSLIPLGLTFVCAAILAAVARRFAAKSWGSWLLATASYAGSVGVVAALMWQSAEDSGSIVGRAATAGLVIAAPSVALGVWRAHGAEFGWLPRVPEALRMGVRLGLGTTALLVACGAAVTVVWAFVGSYAMADAVTALGVDAVGGLSLAIMQTMYAPVVAVWMLAWLTGVGFSVGEASVFAPSVVATDALPMIPLLGALPNAAGGLLLWAPVVVVAAGAVAWTALRHRLPLGRTTVGAGVVAVAVVALLLWILMTLASGSAGPGRLTVTGAEAGAVAVVGSALIAGGFLLASILWLVVGGRTAATPER